MRVRCAVIGLGTFGRAVALKAAQEGAEVIVIDKDKDKIESIKDEVSVAIQADATDEKALREHDIGSVDVAVVAIGETFEGLLLCTVHLLNLGVKRVIARAFNQVQRLILEKMGVSEIISPEEEAGRALAERIVHPEFRAYIPLPGEYEIVEVQAPDTFIGRSVGDIDFMRRYNITLVTIKRMDESTGSYMVVGCIKPTEVVKKGDMLIVMGHKKDIDRFLEVVERSK